MTTRAPAVDGRDAASRETLLQDFEAGRKPALARIISIVENERPGFRQLLATLHGRLGRAHRIGITGPPGAGKSTLTAELVRHYRARGERVAVVAVDPTSPFTGGALLGDRIRMGEVSLDDGVFIRSMATRGSLGGLALSTKEVSDVLDAFGFDRILVETVGVGQSELDIASAADTTVVIVVPESGDSVQAMKAGLMEASDLFVVNKADRPGAERMARELMQMLHLRLGHTLRNVPAHHGVDLRRAAGGRPRPAQSPPPTEATQWEIPVLQTVAETGKGVAELAEVIERHREWLIRSGEQARRRRRRLADRVREEVDRRMRRSAWLDRGGQARLETALEDLEAGRTTPYEVAAEIAGEIESAEPPRGPAG